VETQALRPLMVSIEDATKLLGLGRTRIKQLCADGTLPSARVGNRRLIPYAAVEAYARSLVDLPGNGGKPADPG
jgi:excisionase family DNA binding protein